MECLQYNGRSAYFVRKRQKRKPFVAPFENYPAARLLSRRPIWLEISQEETTAVDEWCDEWSGTGVVVDDSTALPPDFNLSNISG